MRALTEQVWVDECDGDEEGLADVLMDDNTIASVARPGTSLRTAPPSSASGGPSQAFRYGLIISDLSYKSIFGRSIIQYAGFQYLQYVHTGK